MIGIIGAMQIEVDAIISMLENKSIEEFSSITFTKGKINSIDVVVAKCGIGKVFAGICAQAMIIKYNPEKILNVGVAGTISNNLSIGSIAISSSLVQYDMDTSPLGDPVGLISGINIVNIEVDESLVRLVKNAVDEAKINSEIGVIASGDKFVNSKEQKDYIKGQFNAIACEMEGAAIAQVCYVLNKPFCVIRAISDSADGKSHIDYNDFVKMAVENSKVVIKNLFKLLK